MEGRVDEADAGVGGQRSPNKGSWTNFIKVAWWVRGVVSALGLIGVLEYLGVTRQEYLPFSHAIASRWNDLLRIAVRWLNIRLPFDFDLSAGEANAFLIASMLILPTLVVGVGLFIEAPTMRDRLALIVGSIGWASSLVMLLIISAGPGDWTRDYSVDPIAMAILLAGVAVAFYFGARVLWSRARPYVKAVIWTITFIATFEVLYYVPFIKQWMAETVHVIEVDRSASPNSPTYPDHGSQ